MIELVVDSSVWIDLFAERATWQVEDVSRRLMAGEQVGLTDVVLTELLHGARTAAELDRLEGHLSAFEVARLRSLEDFRLAATLHRAGRRHPDPLYHRLPDRRGLHQGGRAAAARRPRLRPSRRGERLAVVRPG
ncbi:MAG: PIN domain-containing protein [Actinomycetota bacterium]|nr:PIN domain-containing protein [Actinomycetota bacterium]